MFGHPPAALVSCFPEAWFKGFELWFSCVASLERRWMLVKLIVDFLVDAVGCRLLATCSVWILAVGLSSTSVGLSVRSLVVSRRFLVNNASIMVQ